MLRSLGRDDNVPVISTGARSAKPGNLIDEYKDNEYKDNNSNAVLCSNEPCSHSFLCAANG